MRMCWRLTFKKRNEILHFFFEKIRREKSNLKIVSRWADGIKADAV